MKRKDRIIRKQQSSKNKKRRLSNKSNRRVVSRVHKVTWVNKEKISKDQERRVGKTKVKWMEREKRGKRHLMEQKEKTVVMLWPVERDSCSRG